MSWRHWAGATCIVASPFLMDIPMARDRIAEDGKSTSHHDIGIVRAIISEWMRGIVGIRTMPCTGYTNTNGQQERRVVEFEVGALTVPLLDLPGNADD